MGRFCMFTGFPKIISKFSCNEVANELVLEEITMATVPNSDKYLQVTVRENSTSSDDDGVEIMGLKGEETKRE